MKKMLLSFSIIVCFAIAATAQSKNEVAIKKAIDEQVAAWNAGDVERFMGTYWQNDSLMFIGKSGVTYGWQNTLNNYKKNYPNAAAMGKLDLTLLQSNRLSKVCYFVVGKWHLTRSIGDIEGHFTLLFKRINGKWLIAADHSS